MNNELKAEYWRDLYFKQQKRIAELEKALELLLEATSHVYSNSAYLSSAEEYAKGLLEKK